MFSHFRKISALALVVALMAIPAARADQLTRSGNVTVSATVLGTKPIVTYLTDTTGANTGAVAITRIVGRNFTGVFGVSLDDLSSTVLDGTITLSQQCDATGSNCGGGGVYDSISGLSVPAGVTPGTYNVLVSTPQGTNLLSDNKFVVTPPVATSTPTISSVSPSFISLSAGIDDNVTISFNIKDSDSNVVDFDTANLSFAGPTVDNYDPVSQQTSTASAADGETVSFRFNSNSTAENSGTMDIRAGDGGSPTTGNTTTKQINVFIDPLW